MKRILTLAFGASLWPMVPLALLTLGLLAWQAYAANAACEKSADEKKLAGAALTSFMTKCEKDATEACTKQADGKKLAGAARNSFTGKCVTDAVGKKAS